MQNLQSIVALDANARFVHLFLAHEVDSPVKSDVLVGQQLGEFAANAPDSRSLRSTFAECLFTGTPQECVTTARTGTRYQFRFEKVAHASHNVLRPEDEIVVIGLISMMPEQSSLTRREKQIVRLVCHDLTNAEIARELKVKTSTIETHRQNIREKLGVNGNAGVVLYGVRHGLAD